MAAIRDAEKSYLDSENEIEKEDATEVAKVVKEKHPVFKKIVVVEKGAVIQYRFQASYESVGKETKKETKGRPSDLGRIAKHGAQPKGRWEGPLHYNMTSEHVLPFSLARELWHILANYLPERKFSEDQKQTTILIYRTAADIKTKQESSSGVWKKFAERFDHAAIRNTFEVFKIQKEDGNESAIRFAMEFLEKILAEFRQEKSAGVRRTVLAIVQDHDKDNVAKRGHDNPLPDKQLVIQAADEQYDNILLMVAKKIISKEELWERLEKKGFVRKK